MFWVVGENEKKTDWVKDNLPHGEAWLLKMRIPTIDIKVTVLIISSEFRLWEKINKSLKMPMFINICIIIEFNHGTYVRW